MNHPWFNDFFPTICIVNKTFNAWPLTWLIKSDRLINLFAQGYFKNWNFNEPALLFPADLTGNNPLRLSVSWGIEKLIKIEQLKYFSVLISSPVIPSL